MYILKSSPLNSLFLKSFNPCLTVFTLDDFTCFIVLNWIISWPCFLSLLFSLSPLSPDLETEIEL